MAKPIINYIYPFDATEDKKITFTYSGDLPYYNRLVIYNASTLAVLYDVTSSSRVLYCTLPADTCTNGTKYAAAIQCFDSEMAESTLSDKVYFWCLEDPSFYFYNVSDGDVITTSSFYAELIYSQAQSEELSQFQFFIYDSSKVLLSSSQVYYSTNYLTYNYQGLEDDTIYYIRAKGLTQYSTELDTGYIEIEVNTSYDNSEYNNIIAECNENNSVVTYYTNFIIITSDEDSDDYEYDDSYINLTELDLTYSDLDIEDDFLMGIQIREYYETGTLLTCSGETMDFTLTSYVYDDTTMRFKLTVNNGVTPYILYSDAFIPEAYTIFTIFIKRVNNIYNLEVYTYEEDMDFNMFFGSVDPSEYDFETEEKDIWIDVDTDPTTMIESDEVNKFIMIEEPIVLAGDMWDIWIGEK